MVDTFLFGKGPKGDKGDKGDPGRTTYANVKDYGAVGDGITNDTAAILAAINAVNPTISGTQGTQWGSYNSSGAESGNPTRIGGVVFFTVGTYLVDDELPIRGFTEHKGEGEGTLIKSTLSTNTKATFKATYDSLGNCQCANIRNMSIWNNNGYGLYAPQGLVSPIVENVIFSTKNWSVYSPDTTYSQRFILRNVMCRTLGHGGIWVVGNIIILEHIEVVNGPRAGFDASLIRAMLVLKGSGIEIDDYHCETGVAVQALAIGGTGPTWGGYENRGCTVQRTWIENIPYNNRYASFENVIDLRLKGFGGIGGGKTYLKDTIPDAEEVGSDISWEFDTADKSSAVIGQTSSFQNAVDADPCERRVFPRFLVSPTFLGTGAIDTSPIGHFGDIFANDLAISNAHGSDAVLTFENVTNKGWVNKLVWTTPPSGGVIELSFNLQPPTNYSSPTMDGYFYFLLDYAAWVANGSGDKDIRFQNWDSGDDITNAIWKNKGPCILKLYKQTDTTQTEFLRVAGNSGTLYFKNMAWVMGGRLQPSPAPANRIRYSNGMTTEFGTAAPTTGWHVKGSVCYNSNATVGQPMEWRCTATGKPGTWVAGPNL